MPHSEWPIQMLHYVPGPSSIVEMKRGALKVVKQCAAVKPGEVVVISADTNKLRIAEPLAATVGVGVTPVVVMIPPTGAQPCLGSTYLSTGVDTRGCHDPSNGCPAVPRIDVPIHRR